MSESAFVLAMIGIMAVGLISQVLKIALNRVRKAEVEESVASMRAHDEHLERVEHQAMSRELNYGRMTFNWLQRKFEPYWELGFRVVKTEPKGNPPRGIFQIHIGREDDSIMAYGGPGYAGQPLILIEFDFLEKFGKNCEAHIFYGAYGPDMYLPIPEHLQESDSRAHIFYELVVQKIDRHAEAIKAHRQKA